MRYTTVIDVTEIPAVWGNPNIRTVYFYLALRSGYHAQDRDRISVSYRRLAALVGISEDAARHALRILEREQLIRREGKDFLVKKWLIEEFPQERLPEKKSQVAKERELQEKKATEEWNNGLRQAVKHSTPEELETWLEKLLKHAPSSRCYFKGAYLYNKDSHVKWLKDVIIKVRNEP